jgi:hypothetical protein
MPRLGRVAKLRVSLETAQARPTQATTACTSSISHSVSASQSRWAIAAAIRVKIVALINENADGSLPVKYSGLLDRNTHPNQGAGRGATYQQWPDTFDVKLMLQAQNEVVQTDTRFLNLRCLDNTGRADTCAQQNYPKPTV